MIPYGIAKITDTQSSANHILLSCSLADAASVATPAIGPAGSVVGTATFVSGGMNPGSAGSVLFQNIDPNNQLRHEGQAVMTARLAQVSIPDNTGLVSRSMGEAKAASQWLITFRTSANVTQCNFAMNAAEQITGAIHSSDTVTGGTISTVGKGSEVEICIWWKGNKWGILIDGGDISGVKTRVNFADNIFYKVFIGATGAGTVSPLVNGIIKNIIISRRAPRFVAKYISVGFFGDSYVGNVGGGSNIHPSWDNYLGGSINRILSARGYRIDRLVTSGNAGYSICDTGASDLSSVFAAYAANKCKVDVIVAGNNDDLATVGQVADVATGTDANLKSWITTLAAHPGKKKIIVVTNGSLRQHVSLDTVANNVNRVTVRNIMQALPDWVDTTFPTRTWDFHLVDLYTLLGGDADSNENYQGQYNTYGNTASGGSASPVATPADRHPSSMGNKLWIEGVARLLL